MLPNTIASVGHACWHAVSSEPSAIVGASPLLTASFLASIRAWLIRCTQYVHFSITPRVRTVTSGFRSSLVTGESSSAYSKKLKRRTLYGQLFEQYRVPMQRL